MLLEAAIILFLIILNGIFAMSEIAILSSRKARLQKMVNEGNARARVALYLANYPGDFLSTIQIGITLIGIFAGAFGGATIAGSLASFLATIPALARYSQAISMATVVVMITFLTIVVGELVPKRIALNNAEGIATIIASPMSILSWLAMPAVRLLSLSTEAILWVLHITPSTVPPISEEEISVLIEQGTRAGVFEEAERYMVESIFRLGSRRASALMVPRTEIVALYVDDSIEDIRQKIIESKHSSFPLCGDTLDNVLGVVFARDLLTRCLAGQELDLRAVLKEPLFIPEGMPALKVLELFKKSGRHMALIIDEYGGLQGLMTIHDILEAVIGEVSMISEPNIVQRADGSWLVDGMLSIHEFKDAFDIQSLPDEESGAFQTIGGFIMMYLHRIPKVGDHFDAGRYSYEVVDMDGLRVDKILVKQIKETSAEENDNSG